MRLPFFTKSKRDEAAASGVLNQEIEAPTTSKKATKALRKELAKKASWEREQEKRRLGALERWEAVLHREAPPPATTQQAWQQHSYPDTVTSAGGRLERSRSHSRRSRRFLDIDHLDELDDSDSQHSDESEEEYSEDDDARPSNLAAGSFRMGSSQTAQLHQVACMRELPMLERCTRRQAPSSFFVDMLLLGDAASRAAADRPERERRHQKDGTVEEKITGSRRRGAEKRRQASARASRSCPTRPSVRP
jgi:hypothetical protein